MTNRIDISGILKTSVSDLYSNLVTRPTGAAVRTVIEKRIDNIGDRALAILDFSHVRLLDFSCADEIVAKLLLQYVSVDAPRREVYFLLYGINDGHIDAIEAVLHRHRLALVTQRPDGSPYLLGTIDGDEKRIWEAMVELGRANPGDVATAAGCRQDEAERALDHLWRLRLVIRDDEGYLSLAGPPRTSHEATQAPA